MKIQRRSQLGFGILEMTVAIAVGLIATVSGVRWYVEYTDQAVFDVAAQQQKQVTESVASYLRDHRESVKATLNANGSANPNAITLHDLSKNGYLPKHLLDNPACNSSASCKMTSPYLQEYKIGTRLTGTGPAQRVEAVLYTKPSTDLTLREATAISRRVGAVGGAIDGGGDKITGSLGGWEVAATTFGAGGAANTYGVASAIFFEDGMEVGDYIHRNSVPGRPELNEMKTNLSLGGNDITAAKNITATDLVSAKDVTASETVNAKDLVVSDKASVINNITSEAGWLIAKNPNSGIQADRFRSVSSVGGQGEASWVDSGGKLVFNVNKGVKVNGRLETTEYLSLGGTATEGAACEKNGLVAKDSSGALLSCQYGSWKRQSKSSYLDSFEGGYNIEAGGCIVSVSACYVRKYTLNLKSKSLVLASLLVGISPGPTSSLSSAGIGYNSKICGYNSNRNGGSGVHSSASCVLSLDAGVHYIEFSTRVETGANTTDFVGGISIWPI